MPSTHQTDQHDQPEHDYDSPEYLRRELDWHREQLHIAVTALQGR